MVTLRLLLARIVEGTVLRPCPCATGGAVVLLLLELD